MGNAPLCLMPIQPIKIPQNVYIEDRIVGPLTLRQIIIIGIGAGFSYALWSSISKAYGYVGIPLTILVWIPAVIAAAFAFLRINDVSLFRILLLTIERMNKPGIRTFAPRRGITINIRTFSQPPKDRTQAPSPQAKAEKIQEISSVLDASFENSDGSSDEGPPTSDDPEGTASALPRHPVQRDRIQASPGPDAEPRVSLFRDISPSKP